MKRNELEAFLGRHSSVVFQMSAGKDSAACLELLRPYLEKVVIFWMNPGNPYQETLEYMDRVAKSVPHFVTITGHQPQSVKERGYPVDVIPLEGTEIGQFILGVEEPKVQPFFQCCAENLWKPMQAFIMEGKFTGVIRGQKKVDKLKNRLNSGESVDGVEFYYPLEEWTDQDVYSYLGASVPDSYKRGCKTSLDCINCTAYLAENKERIKDLKTTAPTVYKEVTAVLELQKHRLISYMAQLEGL